MFKFIFGLIGTLIGIVFGIIGAILGVVGAIVSTVFGLVVGILALGGIFVLILPLLIVFGLLRLIF
jgi:hypothetical protein